DVTPIHGLEDKARELSRFGGRGLLRHRASKYPAGAARGRIVQKGRARVRNIPPVAGLGLVVLRPRALAARRKPSVAEYLHRERLTPS
ncbi:MAG: hypothetical protein JWM66_1124, partial [Solirubrobacterales bacterium]|nr:hypothetical protein [Solirubrobacterales bacterium]